MLGKLRHAQRSPVLKNKKQMSSTTILSILLSRLSYRRYPYYNAVPMHSGMQQWLPGSVMFYADCTYTSIHAVCLLRCLS